MYKDGRSWSKNPHFVILNLPFANVTEKGAEAGSRKVLFKVGFFSGATICMFISNGLDTELGSISNSYV